MRLLPQRVSRPTWLLVPVLLTTIGCARAEGENEVASIEDALRAEVDSVGTDDGDNLVVVLFCQEESMALPIWVGPNEAQAIALEMNDIEPPRPLTHDLLRSIILELEARLDRVVVTNIEDNTYHARLVLSHDGKIAEIDARPSDAIALALRLDSPIYVKRKVLEAAGVSRQGLGSSAALGLGVQELTEALARFFGLDAPVGVLVREVRPDGPAARAGVEVGDVILDVGGSSATNVEAFSRTVLQKKLPLDLKVLRDGSHLELRLEAHPEPEEQTGVHPR